MAKAASLNPNDFTEGGGLIDDVDTTVKEARFAMFDYNGTVTPGVPSLKLVLEVPDIPDVTQFYSMGNVNDWAPSEDGKQLLAIGKASGIRASSNGGIFLKSLFDAGFPSDKIGDDISVLDGLQSHMIRIPAPERKGIKKDTSKEKKFEETILIVSEIRTLPWEKSRPAGAPKAGAAKAGAKAAPATKAAAPAQAPDSGSDVTGKAQEVVMGLLADNDGTLAKKDLPTKVFQALKQDPDRNAVVKIVFDDEFLNSGPWSYNDGTLTMG